MPTGRGGKQGPGGMQGAGGAGAPTPGPHGLLTVTPHLFRAAPFGCRIPSNGSASHGPLPMVPCGRGQPDPWRHPRCARAPAFREDAEQKPSISSAFSPRVCASASPLPSLFCAPNPAPPSVSPEPFALVPRDEAGEGLSCAPRPGALQPL